MERSLVFDYRRLTHHSRRKTIDAWPYLAGCFCMLYTPQVKCGHFSQKSSHAPLYGYFRFSSSPTSTEAIMCLTCMIIRKTTIYLVPSHHQSPSSLTGRQQTKQPKAFMNSKVILEANAIKANGYTQACIEVGDGSLLRYWPKQYLTCRPFVFRRTRLGVWEVEKDV